MSDVTITESHYTRMKEAEAKARAEAKLVREGAEHTGLKALKEGRKGEGLMMIGGANAPAMQAIFSGAAIYYIATSDYFDNIDLFKDHWWLKPLVVLALGYWLFRRQSPWASAVLAAGAAMFVQAWKARPQKKPDVKPDVKTDVKKVAGDATTNGPDDDAGRWDWVDDTYGRRGRWMGTPNGGRTYVTEGHGANSAERIAERVFEHARPA